MQCFRHPLGEEQDWCNLLAVPESYLQVGVGEGISDAFTYR